ncbi:MAG: recombinase family protein [Bryobacteraceae bacterium]
MLRTASASRCGTAVSANASPSEQDVLNLTSRPRQGPLRSFFYLVATSQGLDTDESNPASKLLMHILAAVAQFERELIRERVSAGMRAARAHGTKTGNAIGRPRRIFNRDEVVRLRETGLSIERIAGQIGIGVGTVVRVLQTNGNVRTAKPNRPRDV